ncbi:hypothetical protein AJ79_08086 [Helicocarpus griseus UAMH5409]|uniref:Thioesterase domain-containing protein n=1 Tax=Helicocarpus griseus UAMH5409 TaxID=1447875 RepID=A0A2B7WVY0_9EURO|nr:hypothetical protein AJ79_08086 [Helicocarpus griseus UAMH5409]
MSSSSSSSAPFSAAYPNTPPYKIPAATLAHFRSHPWTIPYLSLPTHITTKTSSRDSDPATGEDAFFARTLGTSSTIPHCLTIRKTNPSIPPSTPPLPYPPPGTGPNHLPPAATIPATEIDLYALFALSKPGISGHPDTAHGGVVATLLDEVMSLAVSCHVPGYGENEKVERSRLYTVQLDVRYKKPVKLARCAVVKAWCVAKSGRKFFMRGVLVQEDEGGKGEAVCTEAYGVWVQARKGNL